MRVICGAQGRGRAAMRCKQRGFRCSPQGPAGLRTPVLRHPLPEHRQRVSQASAPGSADGVGRPHSYRRWGSAVRRPVHRLRFVGCTGSKCACRMHRACAAYGLNNCCLCLVLLPGLDARADRGRADPEVGVPGPADTVAAQLPARHKVSGANNGAIAVLHICHDDCADKSWLPCYILGPL